MPLGFNEQFVFRRLTGTQKIKTKDLIDLFSWDSPLCEVDGFILKDTEESSISIVDNEWIDA